MDPLIWAVLLMLLAIALVVTEILSPPPYGIIGFLAVAAAVASVYMAFHYKGTATGLAFVAVALVGLPTALGLAIRYWPNTAMGRAVLLSAPTSEDVLPKDDPRHQLQQLIGKLGTAKTLMVPGGTVLLEGRVYEAVSEGMPIEAGEPIQVVQIRHNRLVVRRAEAARPPLNPEDVLSQPIDSLGLDSFDDPLA